MNHSLNKLDRNIWTNDMSFFQAIQKEILWNNQILHEKFWKDQKTVILLTKVSISYDLQVSIK